MFASSDSRSVSFLGREVEKRDRDGRLYKRCSNMSQG